MPRDDMPEMSREEAFAELKARGATHAVVEFQGGHDEGGVEAITLFNGEQEIGELPTDYDVWYVDAPGQPMKQRELKEKELADASLAEALSQPVEDKYYTFAGDFHVDGTVTWNVADKSCKMKATETVDSYEDVEEDV